MKRTLAILVSALLGLTLTACGGRNIATPAKDGADSSVALDYNCYITSKGFFAYTDSAYIFCNNNRLTFLEPTLTAPISQLCTKPNCNHSDDTCSSHVDGSAGVFSDGNYLYYISENNGLELQRLDIDGTDRRTIGKLNVVTGNEFSYPHQIGCGAVLLDLWIWDIDTERQKLCLFSLEHPEQEPIVLFEGVYDPKLSSEENVAAFYYSIWDDWVLYVVRTGLGGAALGYLDTTYALYGYDRTSGETKLLVEDWVYNGNAVIAGNELTWYIPGQEIHQVQLDTGTEQTYSVDCESASEDFVYIDDSYIFFVSPDHSHDTVICDYEGKYIQSVPVEAVYAYGLSTPDYVFFYNYDADTCEPVCYLEKSAIANGTAEYIPLEHE